ncbi:cytochrome c oxidase subunit II [Brevundimonas sp. SORGH_AS_0993]|uniref:cytochrome c oxidase subunit II n=1 Tax=Brevundimonas sp. SORGH_AS_0993 TaxID=3041794 RepID=UPI0027893C31|nr:cytochrome c oxidase subunit II [Brevundimonas sp. SORGH_AS_0993]MDQ1154173.1 cytochrome c oxidase subunit 2 [Brevundimonas sp. SORGH_AS_0993]
MKTEIPPGIAGWPPPVLDPAGPFAGPIQTVAWVLFVMAAVVMVVVGAALGVALFGPRRWQRRLGGERLIWIAGLVFPVVVLTGLLVYGLTTTARVSEAPRPGEMRVRVTGEMWWWRVAYLDDQGREVIQDANEVHIPAGQPVVFELESADVIHSFWAPRLGGKTDMIPGRRNFMRLQADQPGTYGGQCAEYCGGPHALMGLVVVAHAPDDYAAWLERQSRPAAAVPSAQAPLTLIDQGRNVFAASGCAACHTIRGTEANGLAGPDLTHVGSRQTLGAGILPNNQGTMAGWIADSQGLKPGNRMPSYAVLSGQDVRAVAAYLESLK